MFHVEHRNDRVLLAGLLAIWLDSFKNQAPLERKVIGFHAPDNQFRGQS